MEGRWKIKVKLILTVGIIFVKISGTLRGNKARSEVLNKRQCFCEKLIRMLKCYFECETLARNKRSISGVNAEHYVNLSRDVLIELQL